MKSPIKNSWILFLAIAFALAGCSEENKSSTQKSDSAFIVLKFKAQPGKSDQAISAMLSMLEEVKKEPHYVDIHIHVDPDDRSNILFYEEWEDLDYYKGDHMNTGHLQAFMASSREFLVGPPEITYWGLEKVTQ